MLLVNAPSREPQHGWPRVSTIMPFGSTRVVTGTPSAAYSSSRASPTRTPRMRRARRGRRSCGAGDARRTSGAAAPPEVLGDRWTSVSSFLFNHVEQVETCRGLLALLIIAILFRINLESFARRLAGQYGYPIYQAFVFAVCNVRLACKIRTKRFAVFATHLTCPPWLCSP